MNSTQKATSTIGTRILKLLAYSLLAGMVVSCSEEVITVDLNDAAPKIVIEGILADQGEPCTVKISESGDFYNPSVFPPVTGATITLLDSEGNRETLAETEAGLYRGNSLLGVEGRTYTLTVEDGGNIYEAASTLMHAVDIDSLTYYFEDDADIHNDDFEDWDEGFVFSCHFTYNEIEGRYHRIKLTLNGELLQDIFMVPDWNEDGDSVEYEFWNYLFEKNDTMSVELLSIDTAVYDYFSTLNAVLLSGDSGHVFSTIPDNPVTNFTGGALGYFAAYSVRSQTVVFD
jgi:hypothetical protein